jgi:hypothetical protein
MIGPGRYDDLCTYVRRKAKARGAVVIVLGGEHGPGFSMQADMRTTLQLPELLEHLARQIREDMKGGTA